MSTLLGFLKSAAAHEGDKQRFLNVLGNPSSSNEERAEAYNGLMKVANHQDWIWLMSQMEQNPGELNSRVMDNFFTGAVQHCHERLTKLVTAEDGLISNAVKAINAFTGFGGAAIFLTHRSLSGLEVLGLTEELHAFAEFIRLACEYKAANGLIPRKLFEERLRQYLPADVVDEQEARFAEYVSHRQGQASAISTPTSPAPTRKPANGNGKPIRVSEGHRPTTPIPPEKYARREDLRSKDEPIDQEGREAARQAAGTPEQTANHALAGIADLIQQ